MAAGIHHVTAISGPARRNVDLHSRVLGQRLVKKTVNFDDPSTYHLYYGDTSGAPGSILTFFPWANAAQGRLGAGETSVTTFRVPRGSLAYWSHRLAEAGVAVQVPEERFGELVMGFADPDGMRFALVEVENTAGEPFWSGADVPGEHAIRGIHGVTLLLADGAATGAILSDVMGFAAAGRDGRVSRFSVPGAVLGGVVDLKVEAGLARGRQGAGTVHHVAFRAADDAAQAAMVRRLAQDHGLSATEQKDRKYFRAVYCREPGGVLFEIATDAPGFAVDEPEATLGQALKLPSGLEARRSAIEAALPALTP